MTPFLGAVFATLLFGTGFASAGESLGELNAADAYYTFGAPTVEVVEESSSTLGLVSPAHSDYAALVADTVPDDGTIILDQIIGVGKVVWAIVEANKPVVNVKTDFAHALPKGVTEWEALAGWKPPVSRLYHVYYKNLFGMKVVDFTYRLLFTYGGGVNGKGNYLANMTIVPADLSVTWGYTFNMNATIMGITNAGSKAFPVAAAQAVINWNVSTVLKQDMSTENYYMQGDGTFKELSPVN